jgi:hypothetical protein
MTTRHDGLIDDLVGRALGRSPAQSSLRCSDADREDTAEVLRGAHTEGRLETSELEQRLQRCYGAKTYSDLDQCVADLPRPPEPEPKRNSVWQLMPAVLLGLVFLSVFALHAVWLPWPLVLFALIGLARATRGLRSPRNRRGRATGRTRGRDRSLPR